MLPAVAVAALGVLVASLSGPRWTGWIGALRLLVGSIFAVLGLAAIGGLSRELRRPRLAYANEDVLFYVCRGDPLRVPLDSVEGFLLGQGKIPSSGRRSYQSRQLIARLSEAYTNSTPPPRLHPSLAHWCDNYLTLWGTWCEPLNGPLVERLNRNLAQAKRARRDAFGPAADGPSMNRRDV
jgi:hypothetical protein